MLYLSFKCVRKFKFCVSPLVKRYPRYTRGIIVNVRNYSRQFRFRIANAIRIRPRSFALFRLAQLNADSYRKYTNNDNVYLHIIP